MKMQVTKQLRTETGHRLDNYDGRCSHLHGHSYLWEVTAKAHRLDDKNMVMDFKDLKKAMNEVLDKLDHALVLAPSDPLWKLCAYKGAEGGGCVDIDLAEALKATNGKPPRLFKWHDNPTAESFAQWALNEIQKELRTLWRDSNSHVEHGAMPYFISSVKVWETATSYAEAKSGEG